jgi:signal transduction histidine kinase
MSNWQNWPFTPSSLCEIVDSDTLKVIESGLSERIDRPLTILDRDPETGKFVRIESINEIHRHEAVCRELRSQDAGSQLCHEWDNQQANTSMNDYINSGQTFRCFQCHVGLIDMTYIIRVDNYPVAMLFTGQFSPAEGDGNIHQIIEAIGTDQAPPFPISERNKTTLHELVGQLKPLPADIVSIVKEQASVIERFAEAEFQMLKRKKEQEFLDELRNLPTGSIIRNRTDMEERLSVLLTKAKSFLGCSYAVFFSAFMENDTVLTPLASAGLTGNSSEPMPHFNWRKANLPLENFDLNHFPLQFWQSDARLKGIRGDNRSIFTGVSQVIPVSLGDRWRGVLMLGPLKIAIDYSKEERFLKEIASTIGLFALTGVEVICLEDERSRWRNTARLLTHQFKTALTPISNTIGRARYAIQKSTREIDLKKIDDLLTRAEDLTLLLAESARETLSGSVSLTYKEDLKIDRYQLSALVANCVNGYSYKARSQKRELVMDPSIENLPEALVDIARMTVALENLIENAIKYSFEDTRIMVHSHTGFSPEGKGMIAVIQIDDLGHEIRHNEMNKIFQLGERGSNVMAAAKSKGGLQGTGLGLWETRSIIEAHGGTIKADCTPTSIIRQEGRAYRVIFSIILPLKRT